MGPYSLGMKKYTRSFLESYGHGAVDSGLGGPGILVYQQKAVLRFCPHFSVLEFQNSRFGSHFEQLADHP